MPLSSKNMGPNPLNLSTDSVAGGRAGAIATESTWALQDAIHLLHSVDSVRAGASHAFTSVGGAVLGSLGGIIGVAAGTGISAFVNHLVHGHHEKAVTEEYRPQLAAITGKDEKDIGVQDLYDVARTNPSLDEDLDRNRGMRNLRTGATLLASSLALVAVIGAVSLFPPMGALLGAAASGSILSGVSFIAGSMAISYGVMRVAGTAITNLGKKMFGYDKPNVADHVAGLDALVKDDKPLSPEKVMGVFVAASPALQNQIQAEFGDSYDKLHTPQQLDAERKYGRHLPLVAIADAINHGQMDPRELIFTVHGQSSGASPAIAIPVVPKAAQQPLQAMQPQPEQAALAQAETNQPITANQWRDLVEKQRADQEIGAPSR